MFDTARQLWQIMSWNDLGTLLASLFGSLIIGGGILYFVFSKFLWTNNNNNRNQQQQRRNRNEESDQDEEVQNVNTKKDTLGVSTGGVLPQSVAEEVAIKIRETPAHKALLEQRKTADQFEKRVEKAKRNIPLGASSVLVQKGARLIEEGSYDEALVCFLALLYSAVEGGSKTTADNLPAHLAECLRGAGTCYRKMGQVEIAARFFQAERLIYEEMVASLSEEGIDKKNPESKSRAIVASLFRDDDKTEDSLPRRCRILQEVAKQCMKHGHVQVALSYQLKMAAVKRKVSGKAMEPNSDEFHKIAEMLRQLSPEDVASVQKNAAINDDE